MDVAIVEAGMTGAVQLDIEPNAIQGLVGHHGDDSRNSSNNVQMPTPTQSELDWLIDIATRLSIQESINDALVRIHNGQLIMVHLTTFPQCEVKGIIESPSPRVKMTIVVVGWIQNEAICDKGPHWKGLEVEPTLFSLHNRHDLLHNDGLAQSLDT